MKAAIRLPEGLDWAYDSYYEYTAKGETKPSLWYFIVDVTYGQDSSGAIITRCGQATTRVCVYHVDNNQARTSPAMCRMALVKMAQVCIHYQIDLIGGDANAAAYRYIKGQPTKNYRMGNVMCSFNRVIDQYNAWLDDWKLANLKDSDHRKFIDTPVFGSCEFVS